MRLILTILLIGLFKADAQMVINASAPYRPLAVSVCGDTTRLLDSYTGAAAAYSLRKLRANYTGSAIRVRRSSDNTEQNIGFTICGDLDTASLKTFVGTSATDNGFITVWYDQVDTFNLRQTTATNQPNIVNAGVIRRGSSNRPIFRTDGTNDFLNNTASIPLPNPVANTLINVFSTEDVLNVTVRTIYEIAAIQRMSFESSSLLGFAFIGWADNNTTSVSPSQYVNHNTTLNLLFSVYNGGAANNKDSYVVHINNVSQTITQGGGSSAIGRSAGIAIGARNSGIQPTTANYREMIIYRSDQSSNRTGIQTNINNYYSIY